MTTRRASFAEWNLSSFMVMRGPRELWELFKPANPRLHHMVRVLYKYGMDEMISKYSTSRLKQFINYLEAVDYLGTWKYREENNEIIDGEQFLRALKERCAEKVLLNI